MQNQFDDEEDNWDEDEEEEEEDLTPDQVGGPFSAAYNCNIAVCVFSKKRRPKRRLCRRKRKMKERD